MKSILVFLEEYKCGKARLLTMLKESDDPVVKTVQPSLKTGRKWKVTEAVDEAKECLKIKRSVYDLLPSNANLVRWGKKDDPTCPLCQGR
ncbi:reverse transcriptase [Plakobranchus ocellatus]|uniref:Reverse transcriptase n=1 Tax=Plakobranchus ocellatus TaxID=259542 RepID=A0AAV4BZ54_9GAST|nr:reverse transcriptase [Plakobranchus ocellatus]